MKLWGTANHHDFGAIGAAYHRRALERQLQILKGMGVNALRTSHNPPVPELLDLADQMGFLVMDEAFDVWETGKNGLNDYHLDFKQWAQTDLQEFVRRDRNHASVIMWSIGNEIAGASTATAANLMKWVKAIDTTRPVTWACNNMGDSTNQAVAALLDLQGYNYLQNGSVTSPIFDGQHSSHPTWKIFGSEMESGGRSRGFYSSPADKPTTWGTCNDAVKECSDYPDTQASPADYEQMYVIEIEPSLVRRGVRLDRVRLRGRALAVLQRRQELVLRHRRYRGLPQERLLLLAEPAYGRADGPHLPALELDGRNNGECLGLQQLRQRRIVPQRYVARVEVVHVQQHRQPRVDGALGERRARGQGHEGRHGGRNRRGGHRRVAAKVGLAVDRTTIGADGWDLAYVTAVIQDSAGATVPTANNSVTFAVSGPGKLVGVDNGDPIDLTAYSSPTRKAFNGKALAIVQSTGSPGQITVTATSSGLTAGSVSTAAR